MQDREKKLAIVLAGALLVMVVMPMFEGSFLKPLAAKRGELTTAQASVKKLTDSQLQLRIAQQNLEDWQYQSLPPDRNTAQRLYSIWLQNLARMSGFSSIEPAGLRSLPSRAATFVEIPVTITAKATLEQLARFLYHFERAALLHRVHRLEITSPASVGNPLLQVKLECKGLALTDAPIRYSLFPSTTLSESVTAEETSLAIETVAGFPGIDGFQVKIDQELVTIRQRGEGRWTVERGAERTLAAAHEAGSTVELFPVDRQAKASGRSFEDYREFVANSPFTKPKPPSDYRPELSPRSQQIVTRGTPWTLKMTINGWDPEGGEALFRLGDDVPRGLTINPQSGELYWNPGEEVEAKVYDVLVLAKSPILSEQQVEFLLPVKLREPNLPPVITAVDTRKSFSGRPMTIDVEATDPDGDDESLKFTLTGEVPTGATIDEQTGVLKWIPPLTLELGEFKLTVSVADSGDPQQTASQDLTVVLEDDAALFTRLIGIFKNGGEPEVLLKNQTSGETTSLTPGAVLKAADVEGTLVAIEARHVLLQVGSETFRLEMGDNLRQMTPVEPASASAPVATEAPSG